MLLSVSLGSSKVVIWPAKKRKGMRLLRRAFCSGCHAFCCAAPFAVLQPAPFELLLSFFPSFFFGARKTGANSTASWKLKVICLVIILLPFSLLCWLFNERAKAKVDDNFLPIKIEFAPARATLDCCQCCGALKRCANVCERERRREKRKQNLRKRDLPLKALA